MRYFSTSLSDEKKPFQTTCKQTFSRKFQCNQRIDYGIPVRKYEEYYAPVPLKIANKSVVNSLELKLLRKMMRICINIEEENILKKATRDMRGSIKEKTFQGYFFLYIIRCGTFILQWPPGIQKDSVTFYEEK